MLKLIATMKRKPGLTQQEFREYYETLHRKLAHHVAEYMADYRRSYPVANPVGDDTVYNPSGKDLITPDNAPFDCMTEIWFDDAAAMKGLFATMARPEIAAEFAEDEECFIDRTTTRIVVCEESRGWPD